MHFTTENFHRYYLTVSSSHKNIYVRCYHLYSNLINKLKFRKVKVSQSFPISSKFIWNSTPSFPSYILLFPTLQLSQLRFHHFLKPTIFHYFFLTNGLLSPYGSQRALNVFDTNYRWNSDSNILNASLKQVKIVYMAFILTKLQFWT